MSNEEFTAKELNRLDFVHNTIHEMVCDVAGSKVPWDMEVIGTVADVVGQHICSKLKLMTEQEFLPYREE